MARNFVGGSSQFLQNASAVVAGQPFSMGCWFKPAAIDGAVRYTLLNIHDNSASSATADTFQMLLRGDILRLNVTVNGSTVAVDATATHSAGVWQHFGVSVNGTAAAVYTGGGNKGTGTVGTPTGLTTTSFGRNSSLGQFATGDGAEAAIWDAVLSDADFSLLALGLSPLLVRPEALVAYWPLIGGTSPEPDWRRAADLTVTGATKADHPRIVYPSTADVYHVSAAQSLAPHYLHYARQRAA